MKHVGKMKNNAARVGVAYRTLPGDSKSALVFGTNGLPDSHHDALMSVIQSPEGQQANELADILATRRFPDGSVMLAYLHNNGHLKKVSTELVLMTPAAQTTIPLNELNQLIAQQKGISVDELAVKEEGAKTTPQKTETIPEPSSLENKKLVEEAPFHPGYEGAVIETPKIETPVTASDLRSMADKLFKEAQALRRKADELEPVKTKEPATKTKKVKSNATS